ncbi:MAG: MFS transporter [SAR202 cluster bacterium]|nr:MFS transporter [SAR202 cluster bacterium]
MAGIQVAPEVKEGRNQLAVTVVLGHAIKHIYNSGLSTILLPEIKLGLGLSATQLGTLAFSRQMAGWFTTVGAGYLGDRFANKASWMLGISMTLMGISYFFAGFAPNYWVMLIAMLLVGIGPSMYHPPAIGALSRRFPDKRGFAISLHGTGGSVGEVLGPLITAGALTFLMWQEVLKISLFPAILAGFMIWSMMRSVRGEVASSDSTSDYFKSIGALLRKGRLAILVAVTALRSMGQAAIMIFLPVYLREDLAYSAATVAIYLSMAQVVGMFAQPAMGYFSDRLGRKIVLVPSMAAMGFLFFALTYADPGWQLILTVIALGTFLYSLHTIFIAAAMDVAGEEVQSTVVSLIYGASFLGTLSPVFAGLIADNYGTEYTFLYGGAMILLAAIVLALTRLPKTANQLAQERAG